MARKPGAKADIRIGISGWTYAPWRGNFYADDVPQSGELAFASRQFRSIEINGTFYGLQKPDIFKRWADDTPDDFVFAVKAPRFITHIKRLREPKAPLANFLASGVLRLGAKLGPMLWQFPPNFQFEPELLEEFLAMLPHDTEAAEALARQHDERLKMAWLKTDARRPLRHAIEIRHDSFRDPAFIELLRKYDIALVCADTVKWPRLMDVTSDFIYCRLHGSTELYRSGYEDAALEQWAGRIRHWSGGQPMSDGEFAGTSEAKAKPRDVFMYFDNTDKLRAPDDARTLIAKLGPQAAAQAAA